VADSAPAVLLVRFRPGVVGLTRRVVHVVPLPSTEVMPDRLTAHCGTEIAPGLAEMVEGFVGMPCTLCLLRVPLPAQPELPPSPVTGSHPDLF
jgi:hypothetical protein